jgi:DNA-binding NarL/FixJ family response regulator
MEHGIPPALDSFIIDGDVTARIRLKQAMGSVALFGRTDLAAGTREAVTRIAAAAYDYAVIFVSLGLTKDLTRSRDAAFVLVAASGAQDSSSLAACMVYGADGFLFEPYSVDQLVEITQLAAKVKGERAEKRERVAFSLLLKEVLQQLDMVAFRKSVHADLTRSWSKLARGLRALPHVWGEVAGSAGCRARKCLVL